MPRVYPQSDYADLDRDAGAGEWQALRGELVALLDKVETHYGQAETAAEIPAVSGLTRRVRTLRDQMNNAETSSRRMEALRTVQRTVDRFNERDSAAFDRETDDLTNAIAEIRSRQGVAPQPVRIAETPEIRELGVLVGGMNQRLERLEGELRTQRGNGSHVREVAGQVEQLTQVVELLAGAIGETGQVKRLEGQIAALAGMIENASGINLNAINARLDDVSGTVSKLAQLQAEQMEREVAREKKRSAAPRAEPAAKLAPAMHAIEESVRNVYDRIDAIEKNVALSSGDFEKLTGEMAAFTQAMKDNSGSPNALMGRVEALAMRLEGMDNGNGEVAALRLDIDALRDAVLTAMEPRFSRLESQIEALNGRIDTGAVEDQLRALMTRMDDASAQLDGLARLYVSAEDRPDFEALANMVAERTGEAIGRKTAAPVAVFGPDSLKSIEERVAGLIKSAGKTPDYETLADMIANRASEAVVRSAGPAAGEDGMQAMEQRMTALFNTAGKDTAERLTRLEAMLSDRDNADHAAPLAPRAPEKAESAVPRPAPPSQSGEPVDAFKEAMQPQQKGSTRLDSILAGLNRGKDDSMPVNPADEAPLIDPGFKREAAADIKRPAAPSRPKPEASAPQPAAPRFDPSLAMRPPAPQSSFAPPEQDPFAARATQPEAPEPEAPLSSTSTFVAAARRAQRLRQEQIEAAPSASIIGKALARVRLPKREADEAEAPAAPAPAKPVVAERPAAGRRKKHREADPMDATETDSEIAAEPGFLSRHRRPLLLAATLIAVSVLALNLAMQRMNAANAPVPAEAGTAAPMATDNPPPSDDQAASVPPRVIDLIDPTATGSINPGEPMSFSSKATISTPTPPALIAGSSSNELAIPAQEAVPDATGALPQPQAARQTFELPADEIGPPELREAAANGNSQAQFEIAAAFGEGRQVEKDLAEAAKWYERAAAQGFAPAQYRLGNLFEVGSGVEKDLEQARLWYQRGAEAGNRMAMHNLAALYAGGQLGDQQFELAAQWFEKAANHGMTDSQFNLGMLHARGLGVEQSFEQSFKWFSLAARSGDKDAAQARDDIAKSLSAEAVSRISEDLRNWKVAPIDLAANYAPIGTWSSSFDPGETIAGRDIILKVQQTLGRLGLDVGTADGVAGSRTTEAIRAFERATGMSEIGKINPRLLAVLGSQPV